MDNENTRVVEINGVKVEVDLRSAKRVETLVVGSKVKLLTKGPYSGNKVFSGVVVGFEQFQTLPTIIVCYLEIDFQACKLQFAYINTESAEKYELIAAAKDALLECGKCFSDSDTNARHARLKAAIIAAEADAAKVKPERGSCRCLTPDNHHPDCQMADTAKPFGDMVREGMAKIDAERPAPDRLAQTVTDAEVEALRESLWSTWGKDRQTTDWPSRAQLAVGLKAALRARESAPAQEWMSCRCYTEEQKRLCLDKRRCSEVTASAAPRAGG